MSRTRRSGSGGVGRRVRRMRLLLLLLLLRMLPMRVGVERAVWAAVEAKGARAGARRMARARTYPRWAVPARALNSPGSVTAPAAYGTAGTSPVPPATAPAARASAHAPASASPTATTAGARSQRVLRRRRRRRARLDVFVLPSRTLRISKSFLSLSSTHKRRNRNHQETNRRVPRSSLPLLPSPLPSLPPFPCCVLAPLGNHRLLSSPISFSFSSPSPLLFSLTFRLQSPSTSAPYLCYSCPLLVYIISNNMSLSKLHSGSNTTASTKEYCTHTTVRFPLRL
ncbi:hypothetical protein V8E36_003534 [Tilletia maclaganii]